MTSPSDALRSDEVPRYQRPAKGSIVDAVEPEIRRYLMLDPRIPETVIAERIGWDRSITVFRERVAELRSAYPPAGSGGPDGVRAGRPGVERFLVP